MTDDQHENIHHALGRVEAWIEEDRRTHERTLAALEKINGHVQCIPQLAARLAAIEPVVEDWKRMKQRGVGIMTTIGIMGGLMGAGIIVAGAKVRTWLGL